MSCFTTFQQKASSVAADMSAAAASACGFFRILVDAALCAVSIFAVLTILGVTAGILASAVGIGIAVMIAAIALYNRSATACRAF